MRNHNPVFMISESHDINSNTLVSEIVRLDYRSAEVFYHNGINYCSTEKLSLIKACESRGLETHQILSQLKDATKKYILPSSTDFSSWKLSFLADYIENIHHQYLKKNLPLIKDLLMHFVESHLNEFPYLKELKDIFLALYKEVYPHMIQEEEVYFPYVKQIAHAYHSQEAYASLLVRTLRKPIENIMMQEHQLVEKKIIRIRELTSGYHLPQNASIDHQVLFRKLEELDLDLTQHIYLENTFLFPVAITMERELLKH